MRCLTCLDVMKKICDTVAILNPDQIPIIGADQTLYALAKQFQWTWPEYGRTSIYLCLMAVSDEVSCCSRTYTQIGLVLRECQILLCIPSAVDEDM